MTESSSSEELILSSEPSRRRVWGKRPGQLEIITTRIKYGYECVVQEHLSWSLEIPESSASQHHPTRKEGFLHVSGQEFSL